MINGTFTFSGGTLENLNVNGNADLGDGRTRTVVIGNTNINGRFIGNQVLLNNIKVNGQAKIYNSQISGHAIINGNLKIINTNLDEDLIYYGGNLTLCTTTLRNLVFRTKSFFSWIWKPTIVLEKGSHIYGSISFEGSEGKVFLKDGSRLDGKVIHGKVINI